MQCQANTFFTLHTAIFTPRTSHFTLALHIPHFISYHLIWALPTSPSELFSSHFISSHIICQLSSTYLFSFHRSTALLQSMSSVALSHRSFDTHGYWLLTDDAHRLVFELALQWRSSEEAHDQPRGVEGWKQAQRRCSAACGSWIHLWETLTSLWKIRRKNTFRWNSTFESYVRIWIRWRFCWGELNISIGWIFLIVGWCVSFLTTSEQLWCWWCSSDI